ncbi:MAG: hypothetical protein AAF092_11510 [Pseudomonadota bacterium]
MCLSTSALALFLTLIGPERVTLGETRMIVHATTTEAHWVLRTGGEVDMWCTMAPQIDAMTRLANAPAQ